MRIAVASGKGGTGKTFVATNLFRVMPAAALADLDVEAANAHLFLRPTDRAARPVTVDVPQIDAARCTQCGACAEACRFNALASVGKAGVMVFRELCHSCGVCRAVCPAGAVAMVPHQVGRIRGGLSGGRPFVDGELLVGQVRSPVVIREVKGQVSSSPVQIRDCPPGTGCAAREAVEGADVCLLVAEATPFGLSDLRLAVELLGTMDIPCAVVVNRDGLGRADVDGFCAEHGVPIAARIPFSRSVAEWYASGELAVDRSEGHRRIFEGLARDVLSGRFSGRASRHPPLRRGYDREAGAGEAARRPGTDDGLRRLVIVSGKGGTGKTTVAAAVAALAGRCSVADCDVEAPNLHLLVSAQNERRESFRGGFLAEIDAGRCAGCGVCAQACPFGAIEMTPKAVVGVLRCEGCGLCEIVCPVGKAGDPNPVRMWPALSGEVVQADAAHGPLAYGRLWAGGEASGKLVSLVRGRAAAAACGAELGRLLIDGPPGTGCPVNASITGTDLAVVVTEPTQSGLHDMKRILDLVAFFGVPAAALVNKADVSAEVTVAIEAECAARKVPVLGRVPFDRSIVERQAVAGSPLADPDTAAGRALCQVAERIVERMRSSDKATAKATAR